MTIKLTIFFYFVYSLYLFLDRFSFVLINIVNNSILLKTISKSKSLFYLPCSHINSKIEFKKIIIKIIKLYSYRSKFFSSCLSRCIAARILLNLIGIKNTISLVMIKSNDGKKTPHSVIIIDQTNELLMPSEIVTNSVKLINL